MRQSRQEQIDYTTEYIQKTFVDNGNLFRGLGKDSIADQSAISLIICATGICWNQVVCKRMAGKQRLCLVMENLSKILSAENVYEEQMGFDYPIPHFYIFEELL